MAYLLIEEDIRDLAASDDYRGCLDLKLEELKSFVLPSWMVEKMRKYMETLRTENEHRAAEAPRRPEARALARQGPLPCG